MGAEGDRAVLARLHHASTSSRALLVALRTLLIVLLVSLFLSFAIEPAVNSARPPGLAARRRDRPGVPHHPADRRRVRVRDRFARRQPGAQLRRRSARPTSDRIENWVNDTFNANVDFNDLADRLNDPERAGPQLRQRPRRQRAEGRPHRGHGRCSRSSRSRCSRSTSSPTDRVSAARSAPCCPANASSSCLQAWELAIDEDGQLPLLALHPRGAVDRRSTGSRSRSSACRTRSRSRCGSASSRSSSPSSARTSRARSRCSSRS